MKFTLDKKILAGFTACSVILLMVAVISIRNSSRLLETNDWVNHTHEVLYEFEQVLIGTVNAETGARGFMITGEESYLAPFNNARAELQEHLGKVKELTKDNPVQQKNIEEIEKLLVPRLAHLERYVELRRTEGFEKALEIVKSGEGRRLQGEIRRIIDNANRFENTLLTQRKLESENDANSFSQVFIVLLVVIAVTLTVVYIIITANLKALRNAERETGEKNWKLTGSGELVKNMQGNKQVSELTNVIITHLATYLNAQVGALYVMEEDRACLKLSGSYAIDKVSAIKESVKTGEGIIGQVAADRSTISVRDIAHDQYNINTGLGEVLPKNIIACPLLFEAEVIGVIALGSVQDFSELQKEYLGIVSDSIAIAITSAQVREKTKELLEETQQQAEELEMQQQELSQSNDELHTKTELLERSELELKAQQTELQQTNVELEEKANMLETQKGMLENAKTELEKKAHEVETTSKYKSEFLANMSHELRTPLNSILILAQLLSDNKFKRLGEKEIEYAKNIHNSGRDLLNLINEILDISKVEAGKMQLDIFDTSLQGVVDNLSAMFSEMAKNRKVEFAIRFDPGSLPPEITTDKQRLEQIVRNLLSNAFKFTDKGGHVILKIERASADVTFRNKALGAADAIAFSVSDTGLGIPKNKQEMIFEAFQQADGSTKRKYGGTGLGLSISRELAHALGGEIHLQSEEGKGSTFTLYLPLTFDASFSVATDKQIEVKEQWGGRRKEKESAIELTMPDESGILDDRDSIQENDKVILIIEDDKQFAEILLDVVRQRNYRGIITLQGSTGLSYARHFKPDAILLDMKMPVMDGAEVLRQLKNDPALRHIPVQIISAIDQKKEGMELGAFDYISKPVSTGDLQKAFDRIEKFVSKKLKKLLIVEDNREQNNAIRELIGDVDVKCISAYSGSEAYVTLNNEPFDCIIVDLGLPDMTGFELLERIKASNVLNRIPVIVYTGKDLIKTDTDRLSRLADTVVLKTADSHERLLDETILFLHRVESKLPKEKQNMIRKLHQTDEVLKDKKILLVDDDIRNIYSLTNALEDEGLECITAENGRIAVEILKTTPGIDLVLMDIMMPEMDGFEATQAIRKLDNFKKLPIIALTAKAMKGDKEKCLAVGMSDYISKPVNMDQLVSLMRVWLYK